MADKKLITYSIMTGLALILVAYFMGKALGKKTPPKAIPIPQDGDPNSHITDLAITYLVNGLKEDIYCVWCTRNSEPYVKLLALSNHDFVKAYNDWNKRFYSISNETLKQAIDGEVVSATSYTFANIKPQLITRFSQLNLN